MYRSFKLLSLAGLLILAASCNNNKTSISGTIEGGENESLVFKLYDLNQVSMIDSIQTGKNGSFSIRFDMEEPNLVLISNTKGQLITLLPSPGETIELNSKAETFGSTYRVDGSEESLGVQKLVLKLDETRARMDSLQGLAASITDPESAEMLEVRDAFAQVIVNQKRFTIRYLVEHIHSLSSIYALYQNYDAETRVLNLDSDFQYYKTVGDSLESAHSDLALIRVLRADINQRDERFREEFALNKLMEMSEVTGDVLDLSIPDRDGNEVMLSSLKGKVIAIVFWSSQHSNSIQSLLSLQATYKKYHASGFEVYAVSMDPNKTEWMQSVDFNEFNWINVCELSYPESRAAMLYNVSAIPTLYLKNRDGDIVARDLYGRQLETWLDNLI